jgi:hypothetical protein
LLRSDDIHPVISAKGAPFDQKPAALLKQLVPSQPCALKGLEMTPRLVGGEDRP